MRHRNARISPQRERHGSRKLRIPRIGGPTPYAQHLAWCQPPQRFLTLRVGSVAPRGPHCSHAGRARSGLQGHGSHWPATSEDMAATRGETPRLGYQAASVELSPRVQDTDRDGQAMQCLPTRAVGTRAEQFPRTAPNCEVDQPVLP